MTFCICLKLINKINIVMAFNPFSDVSFDTPERKLPKIDYSSQRIVKRHTKSTFKLPNIQTPSDRDPDSETKANLTERKLGFQFKEDIEKKLKTVLEQQNYTQYEEASDSDEDFEAKINKNRQLIRIQKQKKKQLEQKDASMAYPDNPEKNNLHQDTKQVERSLEDILVGRKNRGSFKVIRAKPEGTKSGYMKNKTRMDSLYQKRIKDYRDGSSNNKVVQKKLESFTTEKVKDKKNSQPVQEHKNVLVQKKDSLNMKHSVSVKQHEKIKTGEESLFENLHGILIKNNAKGGFDSLDQDKLMNRMKNRNLLRKPKAINQHRKAQLEARIRLLDEKLANQSPADLQLILELEQKVKNNIKQIDRSPQSEIHTNEQLVEKQKGIWSKISLQDNQLSEFKTTFDMETDRINKYFETNERNLREYVNNQERIMLLKNYLSNKLDNGSPVMT